MIYQGLGRMGPGVATPLSVMHKREEIPGRITYTDVNRWNFRAIQFQSNRSIQHKLKKYEKMWDECNFVHDITSSCSPGAILWPA